MFANNDVGGPLARTVADAAALLTAVAGPDSADPVTFLDIGRPVLDYTRFLDRHGLRSARIGVFRQYFETSTTDPEVKVVTEQALLALKAEGAVLIDPFSIPGYEALEKDLWCGDFEADVNAYLLKHPNAPYHDLKSIVDSGLYLPYIAGEMEGALTPPKQGDRHAPPARMFTTISLRSCFAMRYSPPWLRIISMPSCIRPGAMHRGRLET